jgi:hypothetical protein
MLDVLGLENWNREKIIKKITTFRSISRLIYGIMNGGNLRGIMKRACKIFTPRVMINPDSNRDMRVPYYTLEKKQF